MKQFIVGLVAGTLAAMGAGSSPAETFQVELTTRESTGIARSTEPVSGGIPLPGGVFKSNQSFRLLNPDGREIPCQTTPLVVDTNGTLRWLLLDFLDNVAAGEAKRYRLSPKCHQTWYYTYFDVPDLGRVFDPWAFDHTDTRDGEGCVHSGYYTRFFPDACAKGFSMTGDQRLLDHAREFWYYGSKRTYQSKGLRGGSNEVWQFATHHPPKDDTVLEVSRLFHEASHPRTDKRAPAPVTDLKVGLLGGGKAKIQFVAPTDAGGGKVVRYQESSIETSRRSGMKLL